MKPLYIDRSDGKGPQRISNVTIDDFKEVWIINIKSKLLEIDQKSIKPTREGETEYLVTLTAQAIELRNKITIVNNAKTIEEIESIII